MERKQRSIRVLMFPWLAYGHISPFLELAKKLITRNFCVYLCSTPTNLDSIRPKFSHQDSLSIKFVELHLASSPQLPPHYHTTNGLPPHLMQTLKNAFEMASPSFLDILKTLKPDLLIYDFLQPWAPSLSCSLNIPAVHFFSSSAAMLSFTLHALKNPDVQFPFPGIYVQDSMKMRFGQMLESSSNGVTDMDRMLQCMELSSNIVLVKSFRELEGKYLDYLSFLLKKKIVPVGPLVSEDLNYTGEKMEIIEWLDRKESSSTVFVSFGSEYFLTKEEREEIAYGLELSKVNFIWVVRFPEGEKMKLEEALPDGYLDRVKRRGMVVEGWAPQTRILQHSSIGGFVCHCGWSSIMESMEFGVPIIAVPMNLDQPLNARLVEDAGVGIEVRKREREEIARAIREVAVETGGEGAKIRRKVREMSDYIREKGDEGIDEAVDELVQLRVP